MKNLSYSMAIFCMMCSGAMSLNAGCGCNDTPKKSISFLASTVLSTEDEDRCGCNKPPRASFMSTQDDERCGCGSGKPKSVSLFAQCGDCETDHNHNA